MAHRPTPACHQVGAPALHLSSLHGSSDMAQHLLAIRWVPLHCICQHCMAPQTWLIAQHLPGIRWVPPALHGSSDLAHCSTPACYQVGSTALHLSALHGSSDMAHCSTPACHQVGPPCTASVITAWLLRHGTLLNTCLPSGGSHCTESVITAWLLRHRTMHNTCLSSQSSPTACVITVWLLKYGSLLNTCLPSSGSPCTASAVTGRPHGRGTWLISCHVMAVRSHLEAVLEVLRYSIS